jgi:RNA polymerase sigma-70 factor (ECF subfamily)
MENQEQIGIAQGSGTKLSQSTEADSFDDVVELIDRAKRGDRDALNSLLVHARPRLLAVALRVVRDRDDAEDVVQESLLKVCRYLTRFEGRSAFTTWLHRIVVNTSLDRLRRLQTRQDRVSDQMSDGDDGGRRAERLESVDEETPERVYARAEEGAAVQGAIARLSSVHREALSLREIDGESYQAIAEIARCPVGTVMSRLHHARRRLAVELAPAYGAPAAAMNAA